jgi:hypothetical protein
VTQQLVHNVFFTLQDASDAAKAKMLQACRKYLTGHPGTVYFACGTLAKDLARPVNDRDFDIGLHIIFESQAAHDAYQVAPRHEQFIEENKANWKKVRVFDSLADKV